MASRVFTPSVQSQSSSSFDALSLFRIEYPEKDKMQPDRQRKTSGPRYYVCLHCSNWSDKNKGNAVSTREQYSFLNYKRNCSYGFPTGIIRRLKHYSDGSQLSPQCVQSSRLH